MASHDIPQFGHPSQDEMDYAAAFDTVQDFNALPHSAAFEHALYENRLDRTNSYEYAHGEDSDTDTNPIVLPFILMNTSFPLELRALFPEEDYSISQLRIAQTDAPDRQTLAISFSANGMPHSIEVTRQDQDSFDADVSYSTFNAYADTISHTGISQESVLSLLIALVYARQFDPIQPTRSIDGLIEPTITTDRPHLTGLTEQLIRTLGNHSGHTVTETRAIFDSDAQLPLVVTLREEDFPHGNIVDNQLSLSELYDDLAITTASETNLYQSESNIMSSRGHNEIEQYAKLYTTVINSSFSAIERIEPSKQHFLRWARACSHLLEYISEPMAKYRYLDGDN